MPRAWWLAAGWIIAASPLAADWKITTVSSGGQGDEAVRTEYYKGELHRTDVQLEGKVVSTWVIDRKNSVQTAWDSQAKQYITQSFAAPARRSPAVPVAPETGPQPVINIDSITVDTGERKVFFGRTARHFITTEKRTNEQTGDGPRELDSETVTDGWYIDVMPEPGAGRTRLIGYILTASSGGRPPEIKTTHSGPAPSGMVVEEKITEKVFNPKGATASFERGAEVKELFEGELPQELFQPPSGYTRVAHLASPNMGHPQTFSDEIELYWNSFENWLLSWFS